MDFPYDYTFHHSLIHYLLKRVSRRRDVYKATVQDLIAKFCYDEDYDHFSIKRERNKAKLNNILQSSIVFVEDASSEDASYSYSSESTYEEEYDSDSESEESN